MGNIQLVTSSSRSSSKVTGGTQVGQCSRRHRSRRNRSSRSRIRPPPPPPPQLSPCSIFLLLFMASCGATTATVATATSTSPWVSQWRTRRRSPAATATTATTFQIVETQTLQKPNNSTSSASQQQQWQHANWTRGDTQQACASPTEFVLDDNNNAAFVGEWKIVISSDSPHGWVVVVVNDTHSSEDGDPVAVVRQRTWLRTLQPARPSQRTATTFLPTHKKWIQAIRDDFNFKGFGVTLYKSALVRTSWGVALRLPLTHNFATWERCPGLPSVALSTAIFASGTVAVTLSASVRMEFLQWLLQQANHHIFHHHILHYIYHGPVLLLRLLLRLLLYDALLALLRGLALAISLLLFPLTRQPLLWTTRTTSNSDTTTASTNRNRRNRRNHRSSRVTPAPQQQSQPHYSRTVEERIGISYSIRYHRPTRHWHTRCHLWHSYAPRLAKLWDHWVGARQINGKSKEGTTATANAAPPAPLWMVRRSAAVGWSLSGPVPDPGLIVAAAGLVSLSGLYLPQWRRRNQHTTINTNTQTRTANSSASVGRSKSGLAVSAPDVANEQEEERLSQPTTVTAGTTTNNNITTAVAAARGVESSDRSNESNPDEMQFSATTTTAAATTTTTTTVPPLEQEQRLVRPTSNSTTTKVPAS